MDVLSLIQQALDVTSKLLAAIPVGVDFLPCKRSFFKGRRNGALVIFGHPKRLFARAWR